jgi:hypothetical protein
MRNGRAKRDGSMVTSEPESTRTSAGVLPRNSLRGGSPNDLNGSDSHRALATARRRAAQVRAVGWRRQLGRRSPVAIRRCRSVVCAMGNLSTSAAARSRGCVRRGAGVVADMQCSDLFHQRLNQTRNVSCHASAARATRARRTSPGSLNTATGESAERSGHHHRSGQGPSVTFVVVPGSAATWSTSVRWPAAQPHGRDSRASSA